MTSRSLKKAKSQIGPAHGGLVRALLALALTLAVCQQTLAQQPAATIAEVKAQIARMEQVERDENISADVKALNRKFLQDRRRQLQTLLTRKLEDLRRYRTDLGAALSAAEQQELAKQIDESERELEQLNGNSLAGATGADGPSANTLPATEPRAESVHFNETIRRPVAENPSTALTSAAAADCYADAPPILVDTASAAAFFVVRDGAGAIDRSLQRLIFFTIADAISGTEKDKARSHIIDQIRIRQFMEETARTDKQLGASASSEGSTSAIEKPGFVNLLGFAIEHGAIDKQVDGSSLTLSSSPYALIAAMKGDTSTTYKQYDFFNRIGLSANFNIKDQNNALASARPNQLSEWSMRLRFTGDRSTRSPEFEDFWRREVQHSFEQVPLVLVTEFSDLFRSQSEKVRRQVADNFSTYAQQYLDQHAALTPEAKQAGLQQEILCRLKQDVFDAVDSFGLTNDDRQRIVAKTLPALRNAIEGEKSALELVKEKIKEMKSRPFGTFAYTNKREAVGPDYSTLKFLYERKTFSPMKMVANAGLSFYHKPNPLLNQQSVRDLGFSLSLEGRAGKSPFVTDELDQSQITFAFTGRYERMFENRGIAGRKADLAFLQFKTEIPFMSGLSFPFSITYANASELIKEDHVRANFGFSFDADKLFFIKNFLRK